MVNLLNEKPAKIFAKRKFGRAGGHEEDRRHFQFRPQNLGATMRSSYKQQFLRRAICLNPFETDFGKILSA
ncbi:MAG: hypothetical protein Q7K35_04920 [bacterium]|nr:hypothetical protein [bacterium]